MHTCVPDLQLYGFSLPGAVLDLQSFYHEIDSDSCSLSFGEDALREPAHQTSFPNAGISDQNHFEQKLVVFHLRTKINGRKKFKIGIKTLKTRPSICKQKILSR